jgi:6-phosphogluconolactonase/glucosamine-6-phosphate isomerase/deaminase
MELQIFDTYEMLSSAAAELIINAVKKKPHSVFCFASGDTPKRTYELLASTAKNEHVDFSRCTFIGLDAMAINPREECDKMNALIHEKKGIDFMLVGVGMNGHVGFNEPGTSITLNAHVINLDSTTLSVGQKYFSAEVPASKGITIGLEQVLEAGTLLMMANGKKKAAIIKQALEEEITNHTPASLIRHHSNGILMIDEEAASDLDK